MRIEYLEKAMETKISKEEMAEKMEQVRNDLQNLTTKLEKIYDLLLK